jgi:uncharacterized protein YjbI with pentapeptide repeats
MSSLNFNPQGYAINRELGRNLAGGRITYLATDIQHDFPVVIKHFQFADFDSNWTSYEAHQREINILKHLEHPCIPRYLDDFETPTGFSLVQEYIPAASLAQPRHFTPLEIKQIAQEVLKILIYLQDQKPPIIHGNIKPENILVDRLGTLKVYLVGFGLPDQTSTRGSLGFMPPEQMFKGYLNPASDLYSLGATLICLLTGIKSQNLGQLLDENYHFNLESLKPRVDKHFWRWLAKMVEPKVKNRFPNASLALEALKPLSVVSKPNLLDNLINLTPTKILAPLLGVASLSLAIALSTTLTIPTPDRPFSDDGLAFTEVDHLLTTGECSDCNLRGVDLRAMNLEGSILSMSDISTASLQGIKLQGAVLKLTNFQKASLQGANLQGVSAEKANFKQANLQGANFQGADLEGSDLEGAFLQGANLQGTSLANAFLGEINLKGALLQNSNLSYSYLTQAFLNNSNLENANLENANLKAAHLNSVNLENANLQYAQLNNTNLENANLRNANLTGADLSNTYLVNADLSNANLTGANLTGADLRNANLEGATMPDGSIFRR